VPDTIDALAFWTVSPGRGEIRSEPLASPSAGEAVVRALFSGISRGTEALVFHGRVPATEYQRMRAPFQAGDFPAPVKYGYASVGIVEAGPPEIVGRAVFALYPHQTRYVLPAAALHLVPAEVPPRRAVLAANMETAINGVWDADVRPGDRVAVVGGGAVGCLAAFIVAHMTGCAVTLVDVKRERAAVAAALGAAFAAPEDAAAGMDVVLHTSGTAAGLDVALRLAGDEATVLELSWHGDGQVPVRLGGAFHAQRLTLKSSQVGRVASVQRARWTHERRLSLALSLLAEPALDALITGESAFADLPAVMRELADRPGDAICHCVRYEAPEKQGSSQHVHRIRP
jgi:NADPH:quinone reductase-like Zn-dependent oxidoreductase